VAAKRSKRAAHKRSKRVPLGRRFGRAMRRGFYRVVHAILPEAVRKPIRRVIRGGPDRQAARMLARERKHAEVKERRRRAKDEATAARREVKAARAVRKAAKQRKRTTKGPDRVTAQPSETKESAPDS
jgi:hypothetical protein